MGKLNTLLLDVIRFSDLKAFVQACLGSQLSPLTQITDLRIGFSPLLDEVGDFGTGIWDDTPDFEQNILECSKALVREVPSLQRLELQLRPGGIRYAVCTRNRLFMEGGGPEAIMAPPW
jgi:hypothetical protein